MRCGSPIRCASARAPVTAWGEQQERLAVGGRVGPQLERDGHHVLAGVQRQLCRRGAVHAAAHGHHGPAWPTGPGRAPRRGQRIPARGEARRRPARPRARTPGPARPAPPRPLRGSGARRRARARPRPAPPRRCPPRGRRRTPGPRSRPRPRGRRSPGPTRAPGRRTPRRRPRRCAGPGRARPGRAGTRGGRPARRARPCCRGPCRQDRSAPACRCRLRVGPACASSGVLRWGPGGKTPDTHRVRTPIPLVLAQRGEPAGEQARAWPQRSSAQAGGRGRSAARGR